MEIKHTLLLLEDELESGEILANYLEINEFKTHWAKDGKQALAIIESHADEIDLAILDIMVPYMDGKEICAHIRKHPVLSDIPVLFLTARDEEKDEIEGLELGADDYIKKPAGLITKVFKILNNGIIDRRSNKLKSIRYFIFHIFNFID